MGKIEIPTEPVDRYEVTRYRVVTSTRDVCVIERVCWRYYAAASYVEVAGSDGGRDGVPFTGEWAVFIDGKLVGRVDQWQRLVEIVLPYWPETLDQARAVLREELESSRASAIDLVARATVGIAAIDADHTPECFQDVADLFARLGQRHGLPSGAASPLRMTPRGLELHLANLSEPSASALIALAAALGVSLGRETVTS